MLRNLSGKIYQIIVPICWLFTASHCFKALYTDQVKTFGCSNKNILGQICTNPNKLIVEMEQLNFFSFFSNLKASFPSSLWIAVPPSIFKSLSWPQQGFTAAISFWPDSVGEERKICWGVISNPAKKPHFVAKTKASSRARNLKRLSSVARELCLFSNGFGRFTQYSFHFLLPFLIKFLLINF